MRNRYYDPATGQFTQADPIGLAGGLNAYGFAAGDPVSYSDPYGLKVCVASAGLRKQIGDAFQVDISWGKDNCIDQNSEITARAGSGRFAEIQAEFREVVNSGMDIEVGWEMNGGGSRFVPQASVLDDHDIRIDPFQARGSYRYKDRNGRCASAGHWGRYAIIVHEFGHAFNWLRTGDGVIQAPAIRSENVFNAAMGRRARSEACHP
jgi:uncharacterized protein RhaS with RHS repeats